MVLMLAFATFFSTLTGGYIALRSRDRLHLVLGFTAGVVLGVVAFDLLPEIFELVEITGKPASWPMVALVVGFMLFHVAERSILLHHAHEAEYDAHHHPHVGMLSAVVLVGHSAADGVAIGLAFQVSTQVGVAVALAVISHDFADGMNIVGLMTAHGNSRNRTLLMLGLDCAAAVIGAATTLLVSVGDVTLLLYLGMFTGFLLYIGAADVLPEAHATHDSRLTMVMTVLGLVLMFGVTRVAL